MNRNLTTEQLAAIREEAQASDVPGVRTVEDAVRVSGGDDLSRFERAARYAINCDIDGNGESARGWFAARGIEA